MKNFPLVNTDITFNLKLLSLNVAQSNWTELCYASSFFDMLSGVTQNADRCSIYKEWETWIGKTEKQGWESNTHINQLSPSNTAPEHSALSNAFQLKRFWVLYYSVSVLHAVYKKPWKSSCGHVLEAWSQFPKSNVMFVSQVKCFSKYALLYCDLGATNYFRQNLNTNLLLAQETTA